ncbi:shikimate kinase [Planktotalea sp.]|uniref:shikimate kinase n=1 Tax=Planktotalea sp. TaxID=2029877 RepID=UPI003D6A97B8
MIWKLHKTVVLVGMMGAGKTAVGKAVANNLGVPFLDSDAEIVSAANMSIAEIFERDGEPFFRARESEVIARLLDGAPCVLSTGGGAFLAERNRTLISQLGVSVCLQASLELLWSRVRNKDTRPLLRTPDPLGALTELYQARAATYALADISVQARDTYSIEDMAAQVIDALRARPDVLESDENG